MRNPLARLVHRDPAKPTLRERAASLKASLSRLGRRPAAGADQGRRSMVAGSIMAAMPLPALALPAPAAAHPDQHLLDALDALMRAREIETAADEAHDVAWAAVWAVMKEVPADLRATRWECDSLSPPLQKPVWGAWLRFHYVPALSEENDHLHSSHCAWRGAVLRKVITLAVPVLGRGGQTPHRIRRWKAILPLADAFDARVAEVEAATGYVELEKALKAARDGVKALRVELSRNVATTPEGMAGLVRVLAESSWKDTGGAWPNLLRSAANVSGVPLADLEHQYASTRKLSA
ncbi:hypothetical protein [Methylobacterium sp. CM6247]